MGEAILFLLGCLALAGAWLRLARRNAADRAALARTLGLEAPIEPRRQERAERGFEQETLLARGVRDGRAVELWQRGLRRARRAPRRGTSAWTVLALPLAAGTPAPRLLLEPRLRAAILDAATGPLPETPTGDPDFDSVFRTACAEPAAVGRLLDPALRRALLAWRERVAGAAGDGVPQRLADTAALGPLELEPDRVTLALPGTPLPRLADPLAAALPILTRLAERAERPRAATG